MELKYSAGAFGTGTLCTHYDSFRDMDIIFQHFKIQIFVQARFTMENFWEIAYPGLTPSLRGNIKFGSFHYGKTQIWRIFSLSTDFHFHAQFAGSFFEFDP
jgi:hypothetical protein